MTPSSLGYIGLGAMGGPMAHNLVAAGYEVHVLDTDERRVTPLVERGAIAAGSAAELAASCDVVFTSLPGHRQVEAVYLHQDGLIAGARSGVTLVDMSTVPPGLAREVADRAAERGADFLDAPVARTRAAAIDGTLAIMVGGAPEAFERILPVLRVMGTSVQHIGDVGAGQVAKLVNNVMLMANVVTAAEALAVGARAGVSAERLVEVLVEGSADSFALRNHVAKSVVPASFPEGQFSLDYALKDLGYFFDLSKQLGALCVQLGATDNLYRAAKSSGCAAEYFPVVARLIDRLGGNGLYGNQDE
ncbi:NAD(P)-dependent oxidoreductase [Dactylosporangium sp. NPDC051485]|uniref:NAD(P)-dependent oxidoreductase n=1 Tax=Dactylosporangium sp. NPDC051485 TaxID=3154846 RepID=UPI00342BE20D